MDSDSRVVKADVAVLKLGLRGCRITVAFALAIIALASGHSVCALASESSWEDAIPVQFLASNIELLEVRSTWASDFDYALHMQGPIYFNDCVAFRNTGRIPTTHVQFMFAGVDQAGSLKTPTLSLDVKYSVKQNESRGLRDTCRNHPIGNGERGLWLVAWVNRVDFANGTSWMAPTGDVLVEAIRSALPHSRSM